MIDPTYLLWMSALVPFVSAGVGAYFGGYLKTKGENAFIFFARFNRTVNYFIQEPPVVRHDHNRPVKGFQIIFQPLYGW